MIKLLMIKLLMITTYSYGAPLELPPNYAGVVINGVIDGSKVPLLNEIHELSKRTKDIVMLINSPGGSIIIGNLIIDAMHSAKAHGVTFTCISSVLAASMAFQLLMECDKRYAMKNTLLLFHPPRIMTSEPLLPVDLEYYAKELRTMESKLVSKIKKVIGMDSALFEYHYNRETFWAAEDLYYETINDWLTIVDSIDINVPIGLLSPTQATFRHGELIWISPNYQGGSK